MEYRENRFRSSLRSKASSSISDVDTREKIKDCCRKFIAFMCTQVGVGGLVVGYTIVGAATFQYIESMEEHVEYVTVEEIRNNCADALWLIIAHENIFNKTAFSKNVDVTLRSFQDEMVKSIKKGYDGRTVTETWTFAAALMFSLSIITMIGYGNMVPKTPWGKGVTVLYAVFGIPLYILYFMNMGEVLASTFRWIYAWLYDCSTQKDEEEPQRRVIVPSTACLWVICGYIITGAIMFAEWESWSYLDSTYFCVTSLCKIGLGDFVPGANILASKSGNNTKLVINFVYMLVGLGLVAMCYNLMREEIKIKVQEMREDFRQCLEDTRLRLLVCLSKCDVNRLMMGASSPIETYRFCGVIGYDGRTNDLVYCHPTVHTKEQRSTVVYFGGDMQDFPENMESHRDSKNYLKYNLEETAKVLHGSFPDSHVVVVRPTKIEYKTFSCFKNFVPSNNCGAPEFTPMHFALQHLEKLLTNLSEKLIDMANNDDKFMAGNRSENEDDLKLKEKFNEEDLHLENNNLTLIGFSKGTVVLNQFLYEFHYLKTLTPDDQTSMNIVNKIKDMYWLDGGHSGGKNTWITSRPLLETLTRLGITVHIHVSPYQIQDERRPWIRKEEKIFGDLLRRLGASVHRTVHFENVCPNLYIHFDILNVFKLTNNDKFSVQQTEN